MLKISLSSGHGLNTHGKRTPDGMHEWEFNSSVIKKMMLLLANYEEIAVTRLDDPTGATDPSLAERTSKSNAFGADIHIDVHANAYGSGWNDANGIETFVAPNYNKESYTLAEFVQRNLVNDTGLKNRGVKTGDLYMVKSPKAKAKILVECGFMTNKKEAGLLKSDVYRQKVAESLVKSLVSLYKLKERVTVMTKETELEAARKFVKDKGLITDLTRGNEPLTRDQMALITYRLAKLLGVK